MSYQMWFTMTIATAIIMDVIVMKKVPKGEMLEAQGATWRILSVICFPTLVWAYGVAKSGIDIVYMADSFSIAMSMFLIVVNMLFFISVIVYRFAMGER